MTTNTIEQATIDALNQILDILNSVTAMTNNKLGELDNLSTTARDNLVEAIVELSHDKLDGQVSDFRPEHYRLTPSGKAITKDGLTCPLYQTATPRVVLKREYSDSAELSIAVLPNRINEYDLSKYYNPETPLDIGKFPVAEKWVLSRTDVLANPAIRFDYTHDAEGNPIAKPILRIDGNVVKNDKVYVSIHGVGLTFNTLHDDIINIQRYLDELAVVDGLLKHPTGYCDGLRIETLRVTGYNKGSRGSISQDPYADRAYDSKYNGDDSTIVPFDKTYNNVTINKELFTIYDHPNSKEYFVVDSIEIAYQGVKYTKVYDKQAERQANIANMRKFLDNLKAKLVIDNANDRIAIDLAVIDGVSISDFVLHTMTLKDDSLTNNPYSYIYIGGKYQETNGSTFNIPGRASDKYVGVVNKDTKLRIDLESNHFDDGYVSLNNPTKVDITFTYLDNTYTKSIPVEKALVKASDFATYQLWKHGRDYMSYQNFNNKQLHIGGLGNYSTNTSDGFVKSIMLKFNANGFNPSQIVNKSGIVVDTNNWTIKSTVVNGSGEFVTGIAVNTNSPTWDAKSMVVSFDGGLPDLELDLSRTSVNIY